MPDVDPRALAVDAALLVAFGVQHSLMAAGCIKRAMRRLIPESVERCVYVAASGAMLVALAAWWQPLPSAVYRIEGAVGLVLMAVGLAGGALLLATARVIDLREFFGMAQWRAARRGVGLPDPVFLDRGPYGLVRHPLYLGLLALGWGTPTMTAGRLLLCLAWTAYIVVGARLEERKLARTFGERYRDYRRRVPMLLPWPRPFRPKLDRTRA